MYPTKDHGVCVLRRRAPGNTWTYEAHTRIQGTMADVIGLVYLEKQHKIKEQKQKN